jgi:hypothetical protein
MGTSIYRGIGPPTVSKNETPISSYSPLINIINNNELIAKGVVAGSSFLSIKYIQVLLLLPGYIFKYDFA